MILRSILFVVWVYYSRHVKVGSAKTSPKCGHEIYFLLLFYEFMLQEADMKTEYVVK